jgi:hypothetical protein
LKLILAGSAALCAWLAWRSLSWPLIHDAPIMHYIAWLIAQGAVPYRDVFDMNLPGVYLIHWAVLSAGGVGDVAWRAFDLVWLAAVGALLFVYCRPLGLGPAAVAATLFTLYHLSGGAWRAGQRDFLLCLFLLIGTLGVARSLERGGALAPLIWAGAALGAGMTVKPQSGILWLSCAVIVAWVAWRQGRPALAGAGSVLAAGLAIPVLMLGWLQWRGGLGSFIAIFSGYVLPLYGRVGRVSPWQALGWYRYGWQLGVLVGAVAGLALLAPPVDSGARKPLAWLGVGYGWLHFHLQGKGWEYHLYPLALFVCALVPFAVVPVAGESRQGSARALRRPAAVAVWALLVVVLGVKGAEAADAPWISDKARRVAALTRDLAPLLPRGATVQVMDVTEGGIQALLRLGARQPTRFIYDFHFFHDVADPRIQALRSEFVASLEVGQPAAIVVLRDTWNRKGYDRIGELPGLTRLLDRAYTLAIDGDGYRIYAKRADS